MKLITVIKNAVILFLLFIKLSSCYNNTNTDNKEPQPAVNRPSAGSYYLQVPAGWTTEFIRFPIEFAPGIHYTGTEDLRFAKGWGDINSDEHWCYAFAWWLDGKPVIDEGTLQRNLAEYYTGLVNRNIRERSIPENKIVPTEARVKTSETMPGDLATYAATISTLDYLSANPIILNCAIHVKKCDTKEHTALLFQISPKPMDHPVWKQLNMLNTNFSCGK